MASYEVTYEENQEMKSTLVEANTPVEATNRFMAEHREQNVVVICVVRQ